MVITPIDYSTSHFDSPTPMPPPSLSTAAAILTIVVIALLPFLASSSSHICSTKTFCPPFTSPPPFPFSLSAGCGHPSFQLHCLPSSGASITINNLSFSILDYKPNSTSLTLALPLHPNPHPHRRNCTSLPTISALNRSISLSGSPFRVSDSSCSRLSVLKPCPPPNLPNCSHCSLECKLIKSPIHLIHECASSTRLVGECQGDVLGSLDRILRIGFEVEWDVDHDSYFSNCRSCSGICGFNSSNPRNPFLCLSKIQPQNPNRFVILIIIILAVCLLISLSSGFAIFRAKNPPILDSEEDPNIIFLRRHSANLLPRVFPYEELKLSTNCFDPKFKIGDGGFGSVYLGHLNDRLVAVKHLHRHNSSVSGVKKGFSQKSFCNEILILSSINHPNLVKLHGYCSDPRGLVLVYDYVPNGTLADHLHGKTTKEVLTWNIRIDIAVQIAMALEYLHFSVTPPVVHRDITCRNIFVEKDMRVKVGDFGLSRLLVSSEMNSWNSSEGICTGPQGTPGYLDPDYYRSFRLNEKSDIYSFGVVLLELITGMRAVDQNREKREITLVDMVVPRIQMGLLQEVVDPVLAEDGEGVGAVAELAFRCVAADKDDRPNAKEVAAELRRIKGSFER